LPFTYRILIEASLMIFHLLITPLPRLASDLRHSVCFRYSRFTLAILLRHYTLLLIYWYITLLLNIDIGHYIDTTWIIIFNITYVSFIFTTPLLISFDWLIEYAAIYAVTPRHDALYTSLLAGRHCFNTNADDYYLLDNIIDNIFITLLITLRWCHIIDVTPEIFIYININIY